jgi:hypothetical protein
LDGSPAAKPIQAAISDQQALCPNKNLGLSTSEFLLDD